MRQRAPADEEAGFNRVVNEATGTLFVIWKNGLWKKALWATRTRGIEAFDHFTFLVFFFRSETKEICCLLTVVVFVKFMSWVLLGFMIGGASDKEASAAVGHVAHGRFNPLNAAYPRLPHRWLERNVVTILRNVVMYEPLAACVFFSCGGTKRPALSTNDVLFLKLPITEPHNLDACDLVPTTHDSLRCHYVKMWTCGISTNLGEWKCASAILCVG